jgi:hypothetical protein
MAKRNKMETTQVVANTETAVEEIAAPQQKPTRKSALRALSIKEARDANFGRVADADNVVGAAVLKTAAGVNLSRTRVYGYDTDTGRVPKTAKLVVVPGATLPSGVTQGQWDLLQKYSGMTVQTAYDNGVASRSVRRAYRAGTVRFVGE